MQKRTIFSLILISAFSILSLPSFSQKIRLLDSMSGISLRGLSVVDDGVFWASGSKGTVARSVDGGKSIAWMKVKGFEERDFRDIEAFDAETVIIMAVDEPAVILKTSDGGKNWRKVFDDSTKGMFLDAMYFSRNRGIVIGDPIDGTFFIAQTDDGGEHWKVNSQKNQFTTAMKGEAFFAASGGNIVLYNSGGQTSPVYVSGGEVSRIFWEGRVVKVLPLSQGKNSTGANAIAIHNNKGIVVGGDFLNDSIATGNCVLLEFTANDIHFSKAKIAPSGYKSSIAYITSDNLISCGTAGVDLSADGGNQWRKISGQSFHVVRKARNGNKVFLAGSKGRIAVLE